VLSAASAVCLVGTTLIGTTPALAIPTLTVTPTTTARVSPSSSGVLTGLSISGDTTDTLQATVATDLGTLSISTTTGLTLAYNNSWTGTQSVTFTGLQSAIDTGLATATLVTSATTGTAHVGLTAQISVAGYNYLASNQHFYQYVANSGVTWTAADTAAQGLSFDGQSGYLATIPNSTVNTFISSKIANATDIWFGARAYESIATDGTQVYATVSGTTYGRVWRWTEGGSESPIAGGVVSECAATTGGCSFANSGSLYSSWASGEPNNSGGSGSTAYQGEYAPVTNWGGTSGSWNDLSPTNSGGVSGYVVEYGGRTNSNAALGTGFAGVVTATSNVLVAAAATVPAAPTITALADNASADLSWSPASDGGSAITGYQVWVNGAPFTALTTATNSTVVNGNVVTTVTATVTGLTNGTPYTIAVRAQNSVGNGAVSNAPTVTPATVPGAPTAVSATAGNVSAAVTFSVPASNGGSAITGYTVTGSPGGSVSCAASPCTVTGLTNGTAYTFTVHATNAVGSGAESSPSTTVTPATVPGAPTGVAAVRGNAQATVSFTAPASNGGSAITGYTVTGTPGGSVSCSASPCTVTGLTNGTAYTFTVHATNVAGNSAESTASAAVTPATVPGAPTSVAAVRGNAQATVTFVAPSGNGSAITGYTVTGTPGGTLSCSASPCTVTGLTNGTAYTFTVHATNAVGDGAESTASSAVTPATTPGAPTAVSAVRGNAQAVVSFTAPAGDGGSAITSYTVTGTPGGSASCSASPCTVTGLTNGTAYTFTVHATNGVGNSSESTASTAVTPATVPGAPTGVSAVRGNGQAVVTFAAPAGNGGSAITGYTVTGTPGGSVSCTTSPCTVTGLTNGMSYTFTVHATNTLGDSAESAASTAVTPATVPGAPTGVSAVRGSGQAVVAFAAPAGNGGSAITGYTVTGTPGGSVSCTASPCTVTGLTNGTSYTFTVHATNAVGNGIESAASTAVTPATTPGAPTGVSAVRGNAQAVVSFTAPASDGGSAITGYTVTGTPGGTVSCSASPCTVTGLTNGTAYTFTVHATNAVGDGAESAASTAVTPATTPGAPTGVSAVRGNAQAVVSFTAPASDGGSAITGYTVTGTPDGTVSCSASPCTVTGLTNGTAYTFTVHAKNVALGNGPESAPSTAVTPATVPGPPTAVASVRGNAQAVVSFTVPASDGGSAITGYTVTGTPGGTVSCSASPCTVSGLTNGTGYTFTVHATNAVGDGAESTASTAVTPATTPGAPTAASAVRGNAQATVTFTAPAGNGGSAITGYTVTGTPGGSVSCTASPCTVTGLTNGTIYTFTVHATNAVGNSGESLPTTAVAPATVPDPPTGVAAIRGDASLTVSWTAPVFDGGSAITGYTVTASPGAGTCSTTATTSCTVSGLVNGTAYTVRVHATNTVGDSVESPASAAVTPAAVPGAPTVLVILRGDASVSIAFDPPPDNGSVITGYQVSTDGGTTWSVLLTTGTLRLTATVTDLANGTPYPVEVRAVNAVGAGAFAGPQTVTPATVPDPPTGVAAARGNGSVSVSFVAPASDGGSAITGYTLTGTPGGSVPCLASPCTVTGLTNGTGYTFTLHATNNVGDSAESSASATVTPAAVPAAPAALVVLRGDRSASLSFDRPAGNGTPITGYQVSTDGGLTWAPLTTTGTTQLTATVTGLTNGTPYDVEVRATNGVGAGPATSAQTITPASVPGAPTGVVAVRGDSSVKVSFTPPADMGGLAITGYTITGSPGGVVSCSASPCVLTGLTNGTAYTFTVHATNAVGEGLESAPSAAVTPATTPGTPTDVSALVRGPSAVISWTAPADDGGAAVTGYTVTASPGGHSCTTASTTAAAATSCTVTGLADGTPYTFSVHATNALGDGADSAASAPVTPIAAPGAPTGLVVHAGDGSATLSFGPAAANGSAVTHYQVSLDGGATWRSLTTSGSAPLTAALGGLTDGQSYKVEVRAVNAAGPGAAAGPRNAAPTGPPGAPTEVRAARGDGQAVVSFGPSPDNGSVISGYTVTVSPGGATVSCSASPCLVTGLTNGTAYVFSVTARYAGGNGAKASARATPVGPVSVPTAVPNVVHGGHATVSWAVPTTLNGSTVIGYTVTASPGGATCTPVPVTATSCVVPGLTNGHVYTFSVTVRLRAADGTVTERVEPATALPYTGASVTRLLVSAAVSLLLGLLLLMFVGVRTRVLTSRRRHDALTH
jgi:large repetitive protein